jgi:hypothetical protein
MENNFFAISNDEIDSLDIFFAVFIKVSYLLTHDIHINRRIII